MIGSAKSMVDSSPAVLQTCCDAIWPADDFVPDVDASACRLLNAPPRCPVCGGMARPNIPDVRRLGVAGSPYPKHSSVGSISGGNR